jgi:hypothetical protein
MIVWIASYSRSGNTFFRIILRHLYDVNGYAAFDADETLQIADAEQLVGFRDLPDGLKQAVQSGDGDRIRSVLDAMDAEDEIYFFKTHAAGDDLFGTNYKAILLVRDGRDAVASFANFWVDIPEDVFAKRWRQGAAWRDLHTWALFLTTRMRMIAKTVGLRGWLVSRNLDRLINDSKRPYVNWTLMNRSWLDRDPPPHVVKFDDLLADPVTTVRTALEALGLNLIPKDRGALPTFEELKEQFPNFFRKGRSGDWKNHFSARQERLFMRNHGDMMQRLGYLLPQDSND